MGVSERLKKILERDVGKARQPGGLSPQVGMRPLGFESDRRLLALKGILEKNGQGGEMVLFGREGGDGDPVGVPTRGIEGEKRYAIGVIEPERERSGKKPKTQTAVDEVVDEYYDKAKRTLRWEMPWEGSLGVATENQVNQWEAEGMFWRAEPEDGEGVLSRVHTNPDLQQEWQKENRKFMEKEYLPAVMKALGILGSLEITIDDMAIKPGGNGFDGVMKRVGGDVPFVSVILGRVIDTKHLPEQKAWVANRDGWRCQFPGNMETTEHTQEELDFWKTVAWRYRDDDQRQGRMVREKNNHPGDELYRLPLPACEAFTKGEYPCIHPKQTKLDQEWGGGEFHHIIPRGAAAGGILTLMLLGIRMDQPLARMDEREVMMVLRGAQVKKLVSGKYFHLTENKKLALRVLGKYAPIIVEVINSPWNAATLCHTCHDLVHPDGEYAQEMAGLVQRLKFGELRLDIRESTFGEKAGEVIEEMMSGEMKPIFPVSDEEAYSGVVESRRLAAAVLRPYWRQGWSDKLADRVRADTDAKILEVPYPKSDPDLEKPRRFMKWVREKYPVK